LVFLLFRDLWQPLATHDMAGSLVSVICMTGAVLQVRAAVAEWGVARLPRLTLVALFALNPMIVFYAGNGMSEALYLFTLVATVRYLARWIRQDDLRSLVYAGVALGLCYLTRNEAAAAAVGVAIVVLLVGYQRNTGYWRSRLLTASTDAVVALLPFAASFLGWAAASYVITGEPFAQFTSQYGTASQLVAIGVQKPTLGAGLNFEMRAIAYLAPLLPIVLAVSVVRAWTARDRLVLAPVMVLGSALGFDLWAYLAGKIEWSMRYYIVAIPTCVLLAGVIVAPLGREDMARGQPVVRLSQGGQRSRASRWRIPRYVAAGMGAVIAVMALLPSLPASAAGMMDKTIGREEYQLIGFVFHARPTAGDEAQMVHYRSILRISHYIQALHLPDGDVVVDNFYGCIPDVIMTIGDPKVFVIPNDRDFQSRLADPLAFHSRYILVPQSLGENSLAATSRAYPTLWATGARFATLAHEFVPAGTCADFRLYRVIGHPTTG